MVTIQKIGKLFILFLIVAGLASCNDDENVAPFQVIGEAVIVKRVINQETQYARYFYAYGNQPMASAEVDLPEGGSITLSAADQTEYTYYDLPELADFTDTVPPVGQFEFTVLNQGIEHFDTETLEFNDLAIPVIDSVSYSNQTVYVGWELPDSDEPDNYLVRLVDGENNIVFSGVLLPNTSEKYVIAASSNGWLETPEQKAYKVELYAYKYEDGFSGNDVLYNVNDISIASTDVVWED